MLNTTPLPRLSPPVALLRDSLPNHPSAWNTDSTVQKPAEAGYVRDPFCTTQQRLPTTPSTKETKVLCLRDQPHAWHPLRGLAQTPEPVVRHEWGLESCRHSRGSTDNKGRLPSAESPSNFTDWSVYIVTPSYWISLIRLQSRRDRCSYSCNSCRCQHLFHWDCRRNSCTTTRRAV
jgi:hypothetical protein